jgi:hypothetical protein
MYSVLQNVLVFFDPWAAKVDENYPGTDRFRSKKQHCGTFFGMHTMSIYQLKFKIMKLSKLNSIAACVIAICFALVFTPACNNSKEKKSEVTGKENENNVTTGDTTTTQSTGNMNAVKKIGKVSTTVAPVDKSGKMETDKMGYYNYTETAPTFPGGQGSLESYINNNIQYPQEAIDNGAEGTVNVMFTIDENGKPGNAKTTGD